MRRACSLFALCLPLLAGGCHSHYVQATITNQSGYPLNVVQVEYPSASFGTSVLKPGESFHYRFKLLGSGPIKVTYVDAKNGEHTQTGPHLNEGQEGQLGIVFPAQDHADFTTSLRP